MVEEFDDFVFTMEPFVDAERVKGDAGALEEEGFGE